MRINIEGVDKMKNYVFVTHETRDNQALYLSYIGECYKVVPDVNKALRFDIDEVADIVRENTMTWLGCSIVRIEDCTFEKLKTDVELQKKYLDFLYVAR